MSYRRKVQTAAIRAEAHVAVVGIGRGARRARGGQQVVVAQHDLVGLLQGLGAMMGLTVRSHHRVVAAEHAVVGLRDPARGGQGTVAGQNHRGSLDHHQQPRAMVQHGRHGVPVGLCSDIDARSNDDHLPASLGELQQSAHHQRAPVHVLGTRSHGDPRTRGHRHPLQRQPKNLCVVDGGDDAPAFGLRHRPHRAAGVTGQPYALSRPGVPGEPVGQKSDHDPACLGAELTLDGLKAIRGWIVRARRGVVQQVELLELGALAPRYVDAQSSRHCLHRGGRRGWIQMGIDTHLRPPRQ